MLGMLQDVAVKVFLDQDLKVEALDEFRREVCRAWFTLIYFV